MPRFAANLSLLFTEHPWEERFAAAARAGFRAVEYLFAYDRDPEMLRSGLEDNGLEQALLNAWPGDWAAGERGLAALPGREAAFRAAIERSLALAEVVQPGRIHIMAGLARGPEARETFTANLRMACAMAPDQGFTIEALNDRDMPGYHLATSTEAMAVIDAVGAPNLGLQLDLYHAQIMEGDLTRRIEALAPHIAHVQIAGVPDRHEPDRGEANLAHLMATLDRVGYQGWVGCEYHPAGGTEAGLGWLAPWQSDRPRGDSDTEGEP